MGKTADLAMIQQTNIDTLHKEGKSRGSLLKGVAVYRVLYQSILNAKLTGRKTLGWKGAQATGMTASLRSLGELHNWSQCIIKSHHAQTSSGKGLPCHF